MKRSMKFLHPLPPRKLKKILKNLLPPSLKLRRIKKLLRMIRKISRTIKKSSKMIEKLWILIKTLLSKTVK